MFCAFKIAVFLSLKERICSSKEFAPIRILNLLLKEFVPLRIFYRFVFTPFRTYRRKRVTMNVLAIAGSFFLFIEVLGKFQAVYGKFCFELLRHIIEHLEYS